MPYRMRFFDTSDEPLAVKHIEAASDHINPSLLGTLLENTRSFLADLHIHAAAYATAHRRNA